MRKKVIGLLMAICVLISIIPTVSAEKITMSEFNNRINSIKSKYGAGTSVSQIYNSTYGGSACYKDLSGWSSWQCMAWASYVFDTVWKVSVRSDRTDVHSDVNRLFVGDYVRYRSSDSYDHSIFITKISGNDIYYTDGNGQGTNLIRYNVHTTKSALQALLNKQLKDENRNGYVRHSWDNGLKNDNEDPTVSNLRNEIANEDSFCISAELNDNVGVTSVWLNVYGPSGNKGYRVSASNGTFTHWIKYSDYGGYGKFSVHLYAEDASGKQGVQGLNNFYPSSYYADGTHAVILNKAIWKPIEVCDDSFVRLGTEDGTAKHVWRFNREGDGTYKITSAQNGKVLGVENASTEDGARLLTSDDVGGNNQRWVLLEKNGGYVLHPRNTTRVLDLTNGNTEDGTQLQICGSNGTNAQIFAVYGANDVQLTAPTITVNAGTSLKKTLFEWNNVYGEKRFDVKIWKNKLFEGDAYHIEWGTHSPYSIKLPAGHYEAYVDAANELQCLRSNVVAFDVEQDTSQLYVLSNVTEDDTSYIINSEINLLNQPAVYVAAVYTLNGELLDIKTVSLQSGAENASVNLPKYTDASYVKVFLWDNLKNMCPFVECEKIPLQ